jgi:mono/diheme cytochrome c family protein
LIGIIKHGRNLMPAFKQKLNEQEINAVAEYVKSIRVHQEQNDSTATDSL